MNTAKHASARLLALTGLIAGLLLPCASRAADVDIYSGLAASVGNPNILIVMDTAASFDANATGTTPCIINGVNNTMAKPTSNSAGGIEQCALYEVITNLPANVNVGFMIYNANGVLDFNNTTTCQAAGSGGGCLAYPLTAMTATDKAALLNWIANWTPATIKTNTQATAEAMQEAWAYYAGKVGLSGRDYASIQPTAGCQKNFVIFLGNAYSTPGDSPSTANTALTSAYSFAGVANPGLILGTQKTTCGSFTFDTTDVQHNNNGEYLDEWSRFMKNTADIFPTSTGQQSITTYTVGLIDPTAPSCGATYPAVLDSTAAYGGGKYFQASSSSEIVNALMKILNEVQAVNSVFSSATLPVSVNTQGTYLNQIYMGMFRPDALGYPRWVGNVKQYQFQFDNAKNLYLADATREPAISSAGTGFITPGAANFWSCTYSGNAPAGPVQMTGYATFIPYSGLPTCALDPVSGFWANNGNTVSSTAGKAFDLPDGEVVEKAGAGQQTRLANLTSTYTDPNALPSATTGDSPRRLFTYCPQGTGCVADLTHPSNAYTVANLSTLANFGSMYGSGLNISITNLARSGGLNVTATTAGAHGLSTTAPNNTVTIAGASPNEYNGLVTIISVPAPNQFTYMIPDEWPPATATTTTTGGVGGYVATLQPSLTYPTTLSRAPAGTAANATVTATTSTANPYVSGQNVTISGAAPANYNLTSPVTVVTSGSVFQYPVSVQPTPTPTGSYSIDMFFNQGIAVATATCAAKTVTITTKTNHNFVNGDWITISGDTQTKSYNTAVTITWASGTSFSYGVTNCPGASPTVSTMLVNSGPPTPVAITALTRNETAVGTATVTATFTTTLKYFASGDQVAVRLASGTQNPSELGYLVSGAIISCAVTTASGACGQNANGSTTITYTIVTTPTTQASGTIVSYLYLAGSTQALAATGGLTRAPYPAYPSPATATATLATGATTSGFCNGDTISITPAPGTTLPAHEGAYTGTWVITGTVPCTATTCAALTTTCGDGTTNTAYYGFTYGALTLGPTTPATGTMSATNPTVTADPYKLTNWVRGHDNFGDEQSLCPPGTAAGTFNCPNPAVSIRPSVHGDTLHSRPIAVNYGGTTGVVVYYGTNDGVYHAINGNQPPCTVSPCAQPVPPATSVPSTITYTDPNTNATISVPPGGELWGFIGMEFFNKLLRQRLNSPPLLLPSTPPGISPQPQPKDYFIDGPTGLYQEIDGNGTTVKALIFIGERRGGRGLIALDVTNPLRPVRLWRIDNSTPGFEELGQTWSLPKIIPKLKGYCGASACAATNPAYRPVLVFSAGYDDGSEDSEPPFSAGYNDFAGNTGADNMGRAIFIVDAFTGALVWESMHLANVDPSTGQITGWPYYWFSSTGLNITGSWCTGTPPAAVVCKTAGMNYSMPGDVTLVDRDSDSFIDRLYTTDTGGNVWRVDFEPAGGNTADKWQVSNLAALGCEWGPCDTQLTFAYPTSANPAKVQRKFFFPVEFIPALAGANYDMVFIASGDREHPLYVNPSSTAANPAPLKSSPPYAVSSQAVVNRIYMIKDFNLGKDAIGTAATIPWRIATTEQSQTITYGETFVTKSLDDCTGTATNPNTCSTATTGAASPLPYHKLTEAQQHGGYYITLAAGEKSVNAPLVTAGFVYLGTNQPTPVNPNSCNTNLGIARGYQINPYTGAHASIVYDGGGLPPSPVSGIVDIVTDTGVVQSPFCIGCPNALNPNGNTNCNSSALAACRPSIQVNSARRRNYWYLNNR